jgi:hypothetical protein
VNTVTAHGDDREGKTGECDGSWNRGCDWVHGIFVAWFWRVVAGKTGNFMPGWMRCGRFGKLGSADPTDLRPRSYFRGSHTWMRESQVFCVASGCGEFRVILGIVCDFSGSEWKEWVV